MNKVFLKGIQAVIPGGISIQDFVMVTKTNHDISEKILDEMTQNDIGERKGDIFYFSSSDKLKFALLALQKGALVEEVSEYLDWKNFEGLVAEVLESKDFVTIRNHILTKPRMEIDVIGVRLGVTMLIDCKHWKRTSPPILKKIVEKQIQRTRQYVSKTNGTVAVPVIVTLYQDEINFVKKVPIVPIMQFSSFIDEFYGNLEEMDVIKSG